MLLHFESALPPNYIAMCKEVRNVLIKNLKNTRITHRPLLLAIAKLDELIRALRLAGFEHGLQFPDKAPSKTVLGPKAVEDHLDISSGHIFPLPKLNDIFKGCVNVPEDLNKEAILQNVKDNMNILEEYQSKVEESYHKVWKLTADGLLTLKGLLNFFL